MKKLIIFGILISTLVFVSGCATPNLRLDIAGNPASAMFFTTSDWNGNTILNSDIFLNLR